MAKHLPHASPCQICKSRSICMKPSILLIWVAALEQSSKQSCDLKLFSSRERRAVLLAVRWATDCIACSVLRGPLRWRWRVLLDNRPLKVHEDYRAKRNKTYHTNSITHLPVSSISASGREGDREHKQTSFVLAVSRSELVLWITVYL